MKYLLSCLLAILVSFTYASQDTKFQAAINSLEQQFNTLNLQASEQSYPQKIASMHQLVGLSQQTKLLITLAPTNKQHASQEEQDAFNILEKRIWTTSSIYKMIRSIPDNPLTIQDKRTFNLAMRLFKRHHFEPATGKITPYDINATSLPILQYPNPELHKIAAAVTQFDDSLQCLIDQMFETLYNANGIGLAATQIGVHQRVVVMDISPSQTQPLVFINPSIAALDDTKLAFPQGCLSIKDTYDIVTRPRRVRIEALDRFGKPFSMEDSGLIAVCIQHEIDHLNGILFIQHLSKEKQNKIAKRLNPHSENSSKVTE